MTEASGTTRRTILSGVALGVAMLAGCVGTRTRPKNGQADFDGWLSDANGYDGVVDATGRSLPTVSVGGSDGRSFEPAAIRVDAGSTVRWEWSGGGSAHNVAARDGSFESPYHTEAGATFERLFDERGVVPYLCVPHEYAGMKGVVVVV